uniref:Non-specific serine/threonine protein kinase n=1 Tax=Panagrellus redivivus TaxID=6233 RepID=A0A7E4WCJ0_PANRE
MASTSNPTSSSAQPIRHASDIVHQGPLYRPVLNPITHHFILFSDGALLGFNDPPVNGNYSYPDRTYYVAAVMEISDTSSTEFEIKCRMIPSGVLECKFCADSVSNRDLWHLALQGVVDAAAKNPNKAEVPKSSTAGNTGLAGLKTNVTFKDFEFVQYLGIGAYGQVVLGKEIETGKFYAVKMLPKKAIVLKNLFNNACNESRVLINCKHPFVTRMAYSFQTVGYICFAMEFGMGGDLFELLKRHGKFKVDDARFYAAEIACGLGHLHYHGMVYRGLKLENVLLDRLGHVKLADFGLCAENFDDKDRLKTVCGTPDYMAPEVTGWTGKGYGRAVDWWALGIIVYELIFGTGPFHTEKDDVKSIRNTEPLNFPTPLDTVTRDFIIRLLQKKPDIRLGSYTGDVRDVQNHAFFKDMDWAKLHRFGLEPPFTPKLKGDNDTKYFDQEMLKRKITLTDSLDAKMWDLLFQYQSEGPSNSDPNPRGASSLGTYFRNLFPRNSECEKNFTLFHLRSARK